MNQDRTIREQIDACRAGSDDLSLPALAALASAAEHDRALAAELERSQRFDRAAVSALHDVSVPADLLERLLAQISRTEASEYSEPAQASVELDATQNEPAAKLGRVVSRRWIFALAGLAASVFFAAILWQVFDRPARQVTQNQLSDAVMHWYEEIPVADGWKAYEGQPLPRAVLKPPARMRSYQTAYGRAEVYDLAAPGRPRALLFVVKTRDRFAAVDTLPYSMLSASHGLRIGAWQSPGVLYVLVIDEDGQRIDDFLRRGRAA